MKTMTYIRRDISKRMASKVGTTDTKSLQFVDTIFETMREMLCEDNEVLDSSGVGCACQPPVYRSRSAGRKFPSRRDAGWENGEERLETGNWKVENGGSQCLNKVDRFYFLVTS